MKPADRVIIYRLGSLGDTVVALPCFHLIERAFPDAERLALTNIPVASNAAPLASVLEEGGFIHGDISYPVGQRDPAALLRLATRLRAQRADALVYLHAPRSLAVTLRDVAYFRFCGFGSIIGVPLRPDMRNQRVDGRGELEREAVRLGRTLAALGTIDFADRGWWDLRLSESERSEARIALAPAGHDPFIVVNTGGKAAQKDWGEANWASTLTGLSAGLARRGLIFVGAAEDSARSGRLAKRWAGGAPAIDLCGQLTPRASAAVIEEADLFIGHDSGPLHLADAVGTPSVGLYGSYNAPKKWHPAGTHTRVIHRMEGLSSITPTEVIELALMTARARVR